MIEILYDFIDSIAVPSEAPSNIEAVLLNSTAVYLKWLQPPNNTINGKYYIQPTLSIHNHTHTQPMQ